MDDEKDNSEEQQASAEPQGPQGGERLADARRTLQISVSEIAKELHLDEVKVHALERNDFDILGAPVFAKGHLRKYAQLVNVDESDVMADYYQLTRAASTPPLVAARRRPRREMTPGPWIMVIVAIVLAATAYWWFTSRPASVEPAPSEAVPEEALPTGEAALPAVAVERILPAAVADNDNNDSADAGALVEDDSAVLESALDEEDAAASTSLPAPDLGAGQMRMLLTYSGDCWTEISDAEGRRLFFDLGKDGRTVELSGDAPFNVLFGNADNVRIRVNGSERVISAAERRGRTARLTIAGN